MRSMMSEIEGETTILIGSCAQGGIEGHKNVTPVGRRVNGFPP